MRVEMVDLNPGRQVVFSDRFQELARCDSPVVPGKRFRVRTRGWGEIGELIGVVSRDPDAALANHRDQARRSETRHSGADVRTRNRAQLADRAVDGEGGEIYDCRIYEITVPPGIINCDMAQHDI